MPVEIKNRFTGAVLHTVQADTLSGADLRGVDLRAADLRGADLRETSLLRADLSGANLHGAYLSRANLRRAIINTDKLDRLLACATRVSDGHEFFLFALQVGPPKIIASCRWMTIEDYRAHVATNYPDTEKAKETLDILNYFEDCYK